MSDEHTPPPAAPPAAAPVEKRSTPRGADNPARGDTTRGEGSQRFRLDAPERRRAAASAEQLIMEEIPQRALRATPRLKEQLSGALVIELANTDRRYLVDWRSETLTAGAVGDTVPDCTIRLSEDNLMRIASGDLNPQISMLSDKVRVTGRANMALYFFNLVAPRAGH